MSVNDPCVSISTGTLSPDLRVNYAYGMVLGLGEFLQEQQYFLQKDYLHERALHGFGTVYGLQVTTSPTAGSPGDYTLGVTPGMAIDQWGREVVVRSAQCARLGAWLAAQEQTEPGTLVAHRGPSGEFIVYAVLNYAECLDDLVPLPGQPCSSSAQSMVASRIRDAWDIELRWNRPAMPEWDTDRRLARMLNAVQIVAGLDPMLSSEADIIEAIRALPAEQANGPDDLWPPLGWPSLSGSPSDPVQPWRLPAETADAALDRIFTFWVTQVRPLLSPALTAPADASDPAILLAAISFTLGPQLSSPGTDPVIEWCSDPDDGGRPYLLHTRLIQELRVLSDQQAAMVSPPQQLVTLTSSVDPSGQLLITAWFQLEQPVALPATLSVRSRTGARGLLATATPAAPDGVVPRFSNVWLLTEQGAPGIPQVPVLDGDQLAIHFDGSAVYVGDFGTTLTDRMSHGLQLLDVDDYHQVTGFVEVEVAPAPVQVPHPTPQLPVIDFVTVTSVTPVDVSDDFFLELWLHPTPVPGLPWAEVRAMEPELVSYIEESDQGTRTQASATFRSTTNVWSANFRSSFGQRAGYVRLILIAAKIIVTIWDTEKPDGNGESMTLVEWMRKANFTVLNWDPHHETISVYVKLPGEAK